MDFEGTCGESEESKIDVDEIIEFPVVLLDVQTRQIKSIFHTYVKPTKNP